MIALGLLGALEQLVTDKWIQEKLQLWNMIR